jgi:aerobic carbon-monoxide dehydrogenase medium subunit
VIPAAVDYLRAESLEEALAALREPETSVLAGGHSLLPMMKLRLAQPARVVDIGRLPLGELQVGGQGLELGALATWSEIAASPLVQGVWAAIADCAGVVGDVQVRNFGTIGGGVAHGDPAADMPAALLALGASVRLASQAGVRAVAAHEFFLGPFTTTREEDELVVGVVVPEAPSGHASAYAAIKDPASGYPLAGAAARVGLDGDRISFAAAAVTGLTGHAFSVDEIPSQLTGAAVGDADAVARVALSGVDIADEPRLDGEFRRQLGRVALRRALSSAIDRAREVSR